MIKYTLSCHNKHRFDVWFGSSSDFDKQKEMGLLECPYCASSEVDKALMAPRVEPGRRKDAMKVATANTMAAAMQSKMREIRDHIIANSEDVGKRFPEEARKIHYGESEERGIRGQATQEQAEALKDEGIEVAPIPALPEDAN